MPGIREKLKALGLEFPPVPTPQGAYAPAIRTGNLIYVSGQLPMMQGALRYSGRVGQEVDVEVGQQAARLCFLNAIAGACSVGIEPEQLGRVVQLTGFVQCAENFHDQPKVLNGASFLAHEVFGEAGIHARMAVGAYALPLNACVEIAVLFEVKDGPQNEMR